VTCAGTAHCTAHRAGLPASFSRPRRNLSLHNRAQLHGRYIVAGQAAAPRQAKRGPLSSPPTQPSPSPQHPSPGRAWPSTDRGNLLRSAGSSVFLLRETFLFFFSPSLSRPPCSAFFFFFFFFPFFFLASRPTYYRYFHVAPRANA
jgi:hypothetical protein